MDVVVVGTAAAGERWQNCGHFAAAAKDDDDDKPSRTRQFLIGHYFGGLHQVHNKVNLAINMYFCKKHSYKYIRIKFHS